MTVLSLYIGTHSPPNARTNRDILFTVPTELGTCAVLELGGGRVHAADAVLRRRLETGVSRPGDLEEVHEAIRQDHRQGPHRLRGHRQEGVPDTSQGRTSGKSLIQRSTTNKRLGGQGA